jgi:hypothetical protein
MFPLVRAKPERPSVKISGAFGLSMREDVFGVACGPCSPLPEEACGWRGGDGDATDTWAFCWRKLRIVLAMTSAAAVGIIGVLREPMNGAGLAVWSARAASSVTRRLPLEDE